MICIDASVAAKMLIEEEQSDRAIALYFAMLETQSPMVAPPLLLYELTNIVRKQMRGARAMSLSDAHVLLADFLDLPIEIHSPGGLHHLALDIASAYNLPASYDAHYLALAQLLDCEFWTSDLRLARKVSNQLPYVRWLGDFISSSAT
jgi:predicted nucleic acid-binding protein